MAVVIMNFYPGINTALQMDVLSSEQKLEKTACSLFILHYSSVWSGAFKLVFLRGSSTIPPLKYLPCLAKPLFTFIRFYIHPLQLFMLDSKSESIKLLNKRY